MVRALLAGTKTQTRRIFKLPAGTAWYNSGGLRGEETGDLHDLNGPGWCSIDELSCPYGQPGDRIWVRETWAHGIHAMAAKRDEDGPFVYAATDREDQRLGHCWKPSIHMPRAASRITLEITGVRVERLQEISEADALAEGSRDWSAEQDTPVRDLDEARPQFRALWTAINGGESWDANPWVWVVEFKRVEQEGQS